MSYVPQYSSAPTKPERKPVVVGVVQVAVFLVVVATPALYFLLMQRIVGIVADRELWNLDEPGDTPSSLASGEFLYALVTVVGLPIVLAVLAVLSAVGLQKRRRWGRILTAVWVGIMLLPLAVWAVAAAVLWKTVPVPTGTRDYFLGPIDPIMLNAIAGPVAFLSALTVFILIFTAPTRRWTPKPDSTPLPAAFNTFQGFPPQQAPWPNDSTSPRR
ncbi:hypothetical protein AB0B28_09210 [Glycomyces sp. NPDC046736]|uniref:hypothetical protein n=1 Tax=Glycomyces sp. NPDC046736 TaxID=3155615 RepID=UPI003410F2C6